MPVQRKLTKYHSIPIDDYISPKINRVEFLPLPSRKVSHSQTFPDQVWSLEVTRSWERMIWCQSHLNTVLHITEIMAFFAVTAAVELPLQKSDLASESLIICYVCTTCLLVGITILVKMIGSNILPHIEAVSSLVACTESDLKDIYCQEVFNSPHDQLFDQISLICILGLTAAPFLFCLDLILIAWIKFAHFSTEASMAVTAIISPILVVILIFGRIMVRRVLKFKDDHRNYLHYGPTRRYSEIAETWDEDLDIEENSNHGNDKEDKSLLTNSYRSNTSYGAVVSEDENFLQCKVLIDMH